MIKKKNILANNTLNAVQNKYENACKSHKETGQYVVPGSVQSVYERLLSHYKQVGVGGGLIYLRQNIMLSC